MFRWWLIMHLQSFNIDYKCLQVFYKIIMSNLLNNCKQY